jgi:molecular chaperone DnaK
MSRVVGIDLGTTNSCVAILDGEQSVVIPNSEGSRTTPSIVGFAENGERLIGQIAKRQALTNPENTVYAVKRLMGRKFEDSEVQRHKAACVYPVVGAANGDAHVAIRGREYSPPEISAMVLAKMKQTAEDYLGEAVTEAVITVPAYFDDAQRQATKDAGRIAGLEVLRIINEPTAAALAYGEGSKKSERVAVYDLGGGTFDISILELSGGVFQVRATNGDTFLGGEDFDKAIVDWLADTFAKTHAGIDLRKDKMALQRLKEAAEKAKHELSSALTTDINLPFITADATGPKHLAVPFSRGQLETLVEPLLQKTLDPCRKALDDAQLTPAEIHEVILVGGQTRMPRVQELVTTFFGKPPHKGVNPDEVVAIGAAIQAGVLKGAVQEVLLLDVTPLSMGVETAGGVFTALIPRNTTIPTMAKEYFTTSVDGQTVVDLHVLQGERELARDNRSLARFELRGVDPMPSGMPKIEVTFLIDANGLLHVTAKELRTGKEASIEIKPTYGLTETEIGLMVEESFEHAEADVSARLLIEMQTEADTVLHHVTRALRQATDLLETDERARIEAAAAALREARAGTDRDLIRERTVALNQATQHLAEVMMDAALRGALQSRRAEQILGSQG